MKPVTSQRSAVALLVPGLLVLVPLLAAGYAFFVLTEAGQALDYAGYFGRGREPGAAVDYDRHILSWITPIHLAAAGGATVLIASVRRRPFTGLVAAAALFAAVCGAEWFKRNLPRPELSEAPGKVPAYFSGDTYPSGHTTAGTSMAMGLILAGAARWRKVIALAAAAVSASYATAVLFLGWHRPSDAFGGILWSALCMGAAGLFLLAWTRPPPPSAKLGPVVLALGAALCAAGLGAAWYFAGVPLQKIAGNLPLAGFLALIVIPAFASCLWLGSALGSAEDV